MRSINTKSTLSLYICLGGHIPSPPTTHREARRRLRVALQSPRVDLAPGPRAAVQSMSIEILPAIGPDPNSDLPSDRVPQEALYVCSPLPPAQPTLPAQLRTRPRTPMMTPLSRVYSIPGPFPCPIAGSSRRPTNRPRRRACPVLCASGSIPPRGERGRMRRG